MKDHCSNASVSKIPDYVLPKEKIIIVILFITIIIFRSVPVSSQLVFLWGL